MHAANFKNHCKAAPYFDRLVLFFFVCQSEFRNTRCPQQPTIGMKKCCKKKKKKIFTNLDLESDPNHILSSLLNANLHNFFKEAWNVEFLTFEKKIRLLLIETKNCDKHVLLSIFMSDVSNESTRKRMVSRNPVPLLFITLHENHSKSVRKPRVDLAL